jgi:hypothetical protein
MTCILNSLSDPVPSKDESAPDKYWITKLAGTSVKSQYEIRFTMVNKPTDETKIKDWLRATFGPGGYIMRVQDHGFYYAEIFFRNESDATMFILTCGELLT